MTLGKLEKYLEENEVDIQSARCSLFVADFYFDAYVDSKIMGDNVISPIFFFVKTFESKLPFYQMVPKKVLVDYMKNVYSEYLKEPAGFEKKIREMSQLTAEADEIWRNYQKRKNDLPKEELLGIFDKIVSVSKKWCAYAALGEDKGQIINEKITGFLVKKYKMAEARAQEIVGALTHPEETSVFNQERKDFLKICLEVLKGDFAGGNVNKFLENEKSRKMANQYLANYFWIKTDFYKAEKITPESLWEETIEQIKNKKESDIREELENIEVVQLKIKKEKEKILTGLNFSKEEKEYLKFAQIMTAWQDLRKVEMMKHFFYIFSFLEDAARKIGTSYDVLVACPVEKLREILKGKKIPPEKSEKFFMIAEKENIMKIIEGEKAEGLLKKVLNLEMERLGAELKGMVANRGKTGKIRGIAKIIIDPDRQEFKKGEILVTSMTRVEFVPIMRRAKAIITDEGGIAAHAAIISRELGIPCIVGTKIATKVMKDRDEVEMDMGKGIVKIIDKNKRQY